LQAIADTGYTKPTPIQAQAIPLVLDGGDLLAAAQTGTGKTAGFTLPLLHRLTATVGGKRRPGMPRCLILTPTRELAAQIEKSVATYSKHVTLTSQVVFGGVNINRQINALKKPTDILIATPGRLLDLVGQRYIDLSKIEILVLDEADRMLDMGFIPDVKRILKLLPSQRQTLLFSATFSDDIRALSKTMLVNPREVSVARRNTASELVDQSVFFVDKARKRALLSHLIKQHGWPQVLVFTKTKHGANRLAEQLGKDGIEALAIHGNKSQAARTKALAKFKDGSLQVLVATDIAARGIDIEHLPNVVNYELPHVSEDYVHRIGRTGRAGSTGQAISLVNIDEVKLLKGIEKLIGKKGKSQKSMRDIAPEEVSDYACEDADITLQLHETFAPLLKDKEVDKLYREVECPLVSVLAEMEYRGVGLDVEFLNKYSEELGSEILTIRDGILKEAGMAFNLNSPKQLGEVLFEKMAIPYKGKKTATGQYSTNEATLSKLKKDHVIISDIMTYRELTKLRSTYVDSLPKLINPRDNRIHTSFRQAIVPTGRLSSDSPNLQNIPIRTERGRKIRTAFKAPDENHVLMAADYSQVELRVIASLSEDENMIQAFVDEQDIHSATASKIFDVALEDVDREMRSKAKAVNFGLIYGQGAFGLSQNLGIKVGEAKEIIESYFNKYPEIIAYMKSNQEFAREHGYVKTYLGRRRYLPDINSANHTVRSHAERNAINTPIQGTAADIIKIAMIDIEKSMQEKKMKSKMVLQVHDELVFEAHLTELEELKRMVNEKMSGAVALKVPLKVDIGVGSNWLEAH